MADIELVIKIPEEEYRNICLMSKDGIGMALYDWIANGTPLPKEHGDLMIDCVSRQVAIDAITHELRCGSVMDQCGLETAYDLIKELPSVEPERKTGHWHLLDECANEGWYCDQCHKKVFRADFSNTMRKYKFCPNCGSYNGG